MNKNLKCIFSRMNWVLILESDDKCLSLTFTSLVPTNVYRKFMLSDFDNIYDFENKIIETMNFHVSLRDFVYVVYDFTTSIYDDVFCKRLKFLSNRVKERIDLHTLNVLLNCGIIKKA
jgi:hypothetical protein